MVVEVTYFVGHLENALIWNIRIRNTSASTEKLHLFPYVEFGMIEYMAELAQKMEEDPKEYLQLYEKQKDLVNHLA